jgi:NAD(P)H-hydrate epimerase
MVHGIEDGMALKPLLAKASVVVIGPGLGQDQWARALLNKVLESRLPAVVDADALNLLAKEPSRCENWVITPHVAEAARLLGVSTEEISADRFHAVQQLQHQFGGIVLLKGAGTLVSSPQIRVCRHGNPGMATAGMGDMLSGIIAALMAQGLSHEHAAELGVWTHAMAGDMEAEKRGERGLVATDLLPWIRQILNG